MADLSTLIDSDFDDRAVKVSTGVPDPVPEGDYDLYTESTEAALTKDQTGALLKVTFSIASGEFEGSKIFEQFNVRNKNMQAQQIGIGELKALCAATGVEYEAVRSDTDLLLHHPFKARVGFDKQNVNPATGQPYAPRNKIKKYYPAGGPTPPASTAPAAAPVAAASPSTARPVTPSGASPWPRKTVAA